MFIIIATFLITSYFRKILVAMYILAILLSHAVHHYEYAYMNNCIKVSYSSFFLHAPVDIDECEGGYHECSQICENTQGGYNCKCRDGYFLGLDGKQCEGTYICMTRFCKVVKFLTLTY